ncbi:hypothetical protein LTR12_010669 [Friedmanniomyces endolithicus]|nr:hypothetical protein LTR12_010669 [Friedmanniomyces endolithicus]
MATPSADTLIPVVEESLQSISNPIPEKTPDRPSETTARADADTKAELVAVKKGRAGSDGPKTSGHPRKASHKSRKPLKKKKEVLAYSSSSDSSNDDFDSDSESESSDDEKVMKNQRKKKKAAKEKKRRRSVSSESEADESEEEKSKGKSKKRSSNELEKRKKKPSKKTDHTPKPSSDTDASSSDEGAAKALKRKDKTAKKKLKDTRKASKSSKRSLQNVYKRVDEVWDKEMRRDVLRPTVKDHDDDFAEHAFLVRRTFNFKHEYLQTMIDVKSRALRSVLREVLKDCQVVSLEPEEPEITSRTMFLYLEDLRTYYHTTLKDKVEAERKRKVVRQLQIQRRFCKALVQYLDEDFKDTKKRLYPLLEAGKIEFDLVHDIQRNALVSIFLRMLEYFQGILFLTTNRVDTFDEAFQSRIHLPLRYSELTPKAKKAVWELFLETVRKTDSAAAVAEFTDHDLDALSRRQLNGRQIKNAVRTAQALALREDTKLGLEHVKKVLDVSEEFDRDLKGGTGYTDAMRSYT